MKSVVVLIHIAIFITTSNVVLGQEEKKTLSLDNSPIVDQFQYVYQKSSTFEDYKMVKTWYWAKLKSHVMDTLKLKEKQISDAKNQVLAQKIQIDSLALAIESTHNDLDKAVKERDSFKMFGIPVQKTGYNSFVWTLIGILAATLLIFLLLYRRSHLTISQARSDLDETKKEFEAFRKRALEREEGIVRKYHNELMLYKSKVNKV